MRRVSGIALAIAALAAPLATAAAQFNSPSYNASKVFPNGSPNQHEMGMAWDGSSYWSVDGGNTNGIRITSYDASGNVTNTYSPGLDFRSIFTDASGQVFGRQFNDNTIYQMTAPGTFTAAVTLTGGSLNAQSSVVLNGAFNEFIAMNLGVVNRWSLTGAHLGTTNLIGFGTLGNEGSYPQNRGIASLGADWLTYDSGTLSLWDTNGNRTGTTILNGAGQTFDSYFSFSHAADNRVWVADDLVGDWRGYVVDQQVVVATPEPATMTLLATGLIGVFGLARRRRKASAAA